MTTLQQMLARQKELADRRHERIHGSAKGKGSPPNRMVSSGPAIVPGPLSVRPLVTVSIPCFNASKTVARAVDSILSQSHSRIRVIVTSDGEKTPSWLALGNRKDERLVLFSLPANRGPYFAHAVALGAAEGELFAIQDADDYSDPRRLEHLIWCLRRHGADAAFSEVLHHGHRGVTSRNPMRCQMPDDNMRHRLDHFGLYRVPALGRIGGYYAGERMGYDTVFTSLLLMSGRVSAVGLPLYHRVERAGSLTKNPETGIGTPRREAAVRRLAALHREAYMVSKGRARGTPAARAIGAAVRGKVSSGDRAYLDREVARLRDILADAPAARMELEKIFSATNWSGWAISVSCAYAMYERLKELRPRRLLDVGSGASTLVMAHYAREHGAKVVSLDHDAKYAAQTRATLEALGLGDQVELLCRPLVSRNVRGVTCNWYDVDLEGRGPFDFVFVDGPPGETYGRQGAMLAAYGELSPRWELWLHDAKRDHERSCVQLWKKVLGPMKAKYSTEHDRRGVYRITPA